MKWKTWFFLLPLLFFLPPFVHSEDSKNYHVTLYGAMLTDGALAETAIFRAKLDNDFKFATLAAGAKIGNLLLNGSISNWKGRRSNTLKASTTGSSTAW